jgi:hypothetical protein
VPFDRPGVTLKPPPLPPCLLPLILSIVGLLSCCILRQGNPTWGTACVPKTLHKNVYVLKKQKLAQIDKSELEQTQTGADDPFP